MKILVTQILVMSIYFTTYSQDKLKITDSTYIIGIMNKKVEARMSEGLFQSLSNSKTIYNGVPVLISGRVIGPNGGYEVIYLNKKYIINPDDVNTRYDDLYNQLSKAKDEELHLLDSVAKIMSKTARLFEIKKALDYIDKLRPKGLAIVDYRAFDESEYTDGTGFRIKVLNLSKKTIKYITFRLTGKNAVDDIVSTKTRKGIGPIKSNETGSYEFEYVWFTDIVEYIKISSITIQYMDGTNKVLTEIDKLELPDRIVDIIMDTE